MLFTKIKRKKVQLLDHAKKRPQHSSLCRYRTKYAYTKKDVRTRACVHLYILREKSLCLLSRLYGLFLAVLLAHGEISSRSCDED